jgi:hypothetical protein
MSKGSWRRPAQVSAEEYRRRWDATFGKKTTVTVDRRKNEMTIHVPSKP